MVIEVICKVRRGSARDEAHALSQFAALLGRCAAPRRIEAAVVGLDGMARLCAVEAFLRERWPATMVRDLVWRKASDPPEADSVRLRALGAEGQVLAQAVFQLGSPA